MKMENEPTNKLEEQGVERVGKEGPPRSSHGEDLRRMNACGHIRRLDDVVRCRPQRDVAPIPDPLARAPRVPGGHSGDEGSLRAVLGKTLQTRTDPLDARVVEQQRRKPTVDVEEPVDALPDSLERRRDGAVQHT